MAYNPTINEIKDIMPLLSDSLHFDYSNFGLSFLKRRIAYLSEILNIRKHQQLIDGIKDRSLLEDIKYHLPVKTTELFRDPSFWRTVSTKIEKSAPTEELTFWLPELGSTEELYSLLIILSKSNCRYKVICNVDNQKRKNEVLSGFISAKNKDINKQNIKRVNPTFAEDYFFIEQEGNTTLQSYLLKNVEIIDSNFFTQTPVKETVFMAIYRNIMLNYNMKLQSIVEQKISQCIQPNGFLALGIQEQVSQENCHLFSLFNENESIYKKLS